MESMKLDINLYLWYVLYGYVKLDLYTNVISAWIAL